MVLGHLLLKRRVQRRELRSKGQLLASAGSLNLLVIRTATGPLIYAFFVATLAAGRPSTGSTQSGVWVCRAFHHPAKPSCGSVSITATGPWPDASAATARWAVRVVFPAPPLRETTAITRMSKPCNQEARLHRNSVFPSRATKLPVQGLVLAFAGKVAGLPHRCIRTSSRFTGRRPAPVIADAAPVLAHRVAPRRVAVRSIGPSGPLLVPVHPAARLNHAVAVRRRKMVPRRIVGALRESSGPQMRACASPR